jgi:hypothetical protein
MKRALIFLLGGPPIGAAVCWFVLLPALSWFAGDAPFNGSMFVAYVLMLSAAYMLGVIPAGLTCLLSAKLARHQVGYQWAWCALFGLVVGFIPLATAFFNGFIHGPFLLAFGLVGAIPAAICSWLSGN